jgi:hypothetical protein
VVAEPPIGVGELVYIYADRNKSRSRTRHRYLVVNTDGVWINIQMFVGNHLRATSCTVKRTECYRVPAEKTHESPWTNSHESFKATSRTDVAATVKVERTGNTAVVVPDSTSQGFAFVMNVVSVSNTSSIEIIVLPRTS